MKYSLWMRYPFRFAPSLRFRAQQAFSLVELSVVVLIISIVAVAGLEGIAAYMGRTAYTTTADKLAVIDKALADYRRVNRRLPCPALATLTATASCYGKQINGSAGANSCNDTLGTCSAPTMASNTLYFGDVPVRDLGLSTSYLLDAYGNKIRYVVTKGMEVASTYDATADGILVRSGKLDTSCGSGSNRCQDLGTAAYFVFSMGKEKRGAHNANGTVAVSCSATRAYDGRIDTANCRGSSSIALAYGSVDSPANAGTSVTVPANAFYDSRYNAGSLEDNYFDDIVKWRSKSNL